MATIDNDRLDPGLRRRIGERVIADVAGMLDRMQERARDLPNYDVQRLRDLADVDWPLIISALLIEGRTVDEIAQAATPVIEARADRGVPLDSFLHALQLATSELWASMTNAVQALDLDPSVVALLAPLPFELAQSFTGKVVAVYRSREEREARADEQRRASLVLDLLLGTSTSTRAAEAAAFGLALDQPVLAFRGRAEESLVVELERVFAGRSALVTRSSGDIVGITDARVDFDLDAVVGYAAAANASALPAAFALATRALETACAFDLRGAYDLDSLGFLPAVVTEADMGDALVRQYTAPLDGLGDFGTTLRATIGCLVDSGLNLETTARTLGIHRNTLKYRLGRYCTVTGADLRRPHEAFRIWWALQRSAMHAHR